MNFQGVKAIYLHEMDRMRRTLFQSIVSPLISTSLYFVVFGSAIGSRITEVGGINYGSFIVTFFIPIALLPSFKSTTLSIKRNGYLWGIIRFISDILISSATFSTFFFIYFSMIFSTII